MLITFEGIDGAGKSTQVARLKRHLQELGHEVLTLREPGGTEVCENIRELLLQSKHDIAPVTELLLFAASRAELVEKVILPALEQGSIVILDRFSDSTTAYQGYGRGLSLELLEKVNGIATFGLRPDITFFLDITPEDAMIRKFSEKSLPLAFDSEELDRMESSGLEFYRRVRDGYLRIHESEPERMVLLDARLSPQILHERISGKVEQWSAAGRNA
ncbi:MAG: dTMP kinase [Chlorobiaceae bacterium]|nr:dTMP kinase [Chlorobiaceae bacterium]